MNLPAFTSSLLYQKILFLSITGRTRQLCYNNGITIVRFPEADSRKPGLQSSVCQDSIFQGGVFMSVGAVKKCLISGVFCLLAAGTFAVPAYAHHGRGTCCGEEQRALCPAVCSFEDCEVTGLHWHGDSVYCTGAHENGYCDGSCDGAGGGTYCRPGQNSPGANGHHRHCRN